MNANAASDRLLDAARKAFTWVPAPTARFVEAGRLSHLEFGLDAVLSAAMLARRDRDGVVAFLRDNGYVDRAHEQVRQAEVVRDLLRRKELPSGGGVPYYEYSIAVALWLLGERRLGEAEIDIALFFESVSGSTKFWREYGRAMMHLIAGTRYERADLKLTGLERCWAAYLELVAALTGGRDASVAVAAARVSFNKRNSDKRLAPLSDYEGRADQPVTVDFRLDGILQYASTRTG